MSKFLVAALMLSLLNHVAGAMNTVSAWDDQDFFTYCPPSRCSEDGPEIRFPLRLESSNTSSSCGAACTKLACSGQDTILLHPALGRRVTAIDYESAVISFVPLVDSLPASACPIQKFISTSIPDDVDYRCESRYDFEYAAILVECSREFTPSGTSPAEGYNTADYVVGPITRLNNANNFSYLVYSQLYTPELPLDCKVASNGVIPMLPSYVVGSTFKQMAERIISSAETTVGWGRGEIPFNCMQCEIQGRRCAFSTQRNETFCEPRGPHGIFIANWPKSFMIAPPLFLNVVLYF